MDRDLFPVAGALVSSQGSSAIASENGEFELSPVCLPADVVIEPPPHRQGRRTVIVDATEGTKIFPLAEFRPHSDWDVLVEGRVIAVEEQPSRNGSTKVFSLGPTPGLLDYSDALDFPFAGEERRHPTKTPLLDLLVYRVDLDYSGAGSPSIPRSAALLFGIPLDMDRVLLPDITLSPLESRQVLVDATPPAWSNGTLTSVTFQRGDQNAITLLSHRMPEGGSHALIPLLGLEVQVGLELAAVSTGPWSECGGCDGASWVRTGDLQNQDQPLTVKLPDLPGMWPVPGGEVGTDEELSWAPESESTCLVWVTTAWSNGTHVVTFITDGNRIPKRFRGSEMIPDEEEGSWLLECVLDMGIDEALASDRFLRTLRGELPGRRFTTRSQLFLLR